MRVEITDRAEADLEDIWQYIAQDNVRAADKVLSDMKAAMTLLSERPGLGHERPDVRSSEYRFWRVYSYLIVYVVRSDALHVLRVVHGARNISSMFGPPPQTNGGAADN